MKLSLILFPIIFFGCVNKENNPYIDKAQLTCYAGDKIIYQITTQPYKIHHPSKGDNGENWAVDSDQGKIVLTGTCVYKPLNY